MRWIFRIVGLCLVAVLVGLAGLLLLPGDQIARIAADQVKAHTGRDLTISGDVRFTLWPVLGVETGPVTLSNADWAGPEPMLSAHSLSIGVAAPDLLRGDIRVRRLLADQPVLRLQTGPDGRGNWEFGSAALAPASGAGEGEGTATAFTLERLAFSDASLVYAAQGQDPVSVSHVDLAVAWPNVQGPADIRATLRPAGEALELIAGVDRFAEFLAGRVSPLEVQVQAPGGKLAFSGRASSAGEAAGRLDLDAQDTGRLFRALGMGKVDLPRWLGQVADIGAQLTFTRDGRLSLRDLALILDGNRFAGAADLSLSGTPTFTVQLAAGAIDLTGLSQSGDAAGAAPSPGAGWSRDPIDASALGLANGTLSLRAESIDTGTTRLGPTRVRMALDRSRAVVKLVELHAWGGALTGRLVANNRDGLSVGGNIKAEGIDVESALTELAGIDRLSGKMTARVKFLGMGQSMDAIMRSLSGNGAVEMGRGVIAGIDLDRLMRSGDATGGTTVFDSLSATFGMQAGNMVNDDLLLVLPVIRARGEGRVGLGDRDIDYLFTPALVAGEAQKGIEIPVRIVGPWADPKIRPDFEAAARGALDENLDALEDEAREKANEKLQEELGVTVEEGQDAEEVIKDAIEDKAKTKLLELLGGGD